MTLINYQQYHSVFSAEMRQPILRTTSNVKASLESFIAEREAALTLVVNDKSFEELADEKELDRTFLNLNRSFGSLVDLGLVDSEGIQRSYVGPYELAGKNYGDQDWFHEVRLHGIYVSDVFLGYRKFPHFVVAVEHERGHDDFYILRATMDTEILDRHIRSLDIRPSNDAFIVNRDGILQTNSRFHGEILTPSPFGAPPYSPVTEIMEQKIDTVSLLLGYAYVEQSPFILMVVAKPQDVMQSWFALRKQLILVLAISVCLILLVILLGVTYMVRRIQEADYRRAQVMHNIQYTSKMATVGRLAAGVAHEINNPLAIINEKAGLLRDLLSVYGELPQNEKLIKNVDSILDSVKRCSTITHQLLGFAKRMDTRMEAIDLGHVISTVLTFLEKEATFRNISIDVQISESVPEIKSDRGQLQQVFLNIVNNAIDATDSGGKITISAAQHDENSVEVVVCDNGHGISPEHLKHIFEPFFTTKKGYGTGLGLSITYGIVQKLGGEISVQSKVGEGTSFTVVLPVEAEPSLK